MTALLFLVCALAITVRVVCVGVGVKRDGWSPLQFAVFAAGCALKVVGALAMVVGQTWAGPALLVGCALVLADRRKGVGV